jgi:hypothetical protein
MKTHCSFCRTKQDRLFGLSNYPDSYGICGNCLARYREAPPARLEETCCFCGTLDSPGYEEKEAEAAICADCQAKFLAESEAPAIAGGQSDGIREILIDWPVYFDAAMDLITVQVRLQSGSLWSANFTTPPRIGWEMEKGKKTGDWASGTYFFHPDLIFVEELTEELISRAVEDLWKQGRFEKAFRSVANDSGNRH